MKVILLEDIKSVGKKGDLVEVSDGYARNQLIKKKKALEATGKNLNDYKLRKKNEEKLAQEELEAAQALGKEIETKKIVIKVKAGEGGRMFGSVSTKEIADEAKKQLGFDLDKKKMSLDTAVKAFGNYDVTIKLHPQVTTILKLQVTEA